VPELELTRTRDDRKLYALEGVGTLRFHGWLSRSATIAVGARTWEVARRGLFQPVTEAVDAAGSVVGSYQGRLLGRGGELQWGERGFALRSSSFWRERYAVVDGERELAVLDGRSWGKRPVVVVVDDLAAIAPELLLFSAFVVRTLAEDSASSSAVTVT
jgi:hypothetical protein